MPSVCEVCKRPADVACASLDIPTLSFCWQHYIKHVNYAHAGKALPGCVPISGAPLRTEREETTP
jgi:hypothetical protein